LGTTTQEISASDTLLFNHCPTSSEAPRHYHVSLDSARGWRARIRVYLVVITDRRMPNLVISCQWPLDAKSRSGLMNETQLIFWQKEITKLHTNFTHSCSNVRENMFTKADGYMRICGRETLQRLQSGKITRNIQKLKMKVLQCVDSCRRDQANTNNEPKKSDHHHEICCFAS
jgi:hypothetical protein